MSGSSPFDARRSLYELKMIHPIWWVAITNRQAGNATLKA